MADYTAKWRIAGENGMQAAFRSILGDAKATADKMNAHFRTVGTLLRAALPGILRQTKDQAVAEIRNLVGRGRLT